jgi:hypothetical protein
VTGGQQVIDRLAGWRAVIRRVRAEYLKCHGRELRLTRPRRYTEKIQWRKLFDLDPCFGILSDKFAARDFIADRLGPELLVPLLWHGDDPDQIPFDDLTPPYVVKSSHASGHTIIVREADMVDRDHIRALARYWLRHCHGTMMDEPAYVNIPRRLIVERLLLTVHGTAPAELKMFVFQGAAVLIRSVVIENDVAMSGTFHAPDWQALGWVVGTTPLDRLPRARPPLLDEMVRAASRLAAGFDHLRVDMYDGGDRFWIGEITLYPWSGMERFSPDEADYHLGAYWNLRHPVPRALATLVTRPWAIHPPRSDPGRRAPV